MVSRETKIPQFYDVLDEELQIIREIYQETLIRTEKAGFKEIETTGVEQRKRYLEATQVHYSKIFEVRRPKEKNSFALQSDLAMSMSRYVADLPGNIPALKLVQVGKVYRDRIKNLPGYRREFKQILLGEWGIKSLFADAETIYLTYQILSSIQEAKVVCIEISNANIFNAVLPNLAEKIRFEGIENIEEAHINERDRAILKELYELKMVDFSGLCKKVKNIKNVEVRTEFEKALQVQRILVNNFGINDNIYFNLHNLEGTGHYSGLHYRIYMEINGTNYLIGDGGRIDTLCSKFNPTKEIPAICMGIGVQVLAQFITKKREKQIIILVDDGIILKKWNKIEQIRQALKEYSISIIAKSPSLKKHFFKSEFYCNYTFILITENSVEVRSNDAVFKKEILRKIDDSTF